MAHGYAVSSFGAAIYSLVLLALFAVSAGDVDRRLNVAAWFAWHPVLLVVLCADSSSLSPPLTADARWWHRLTRQIGVIVAAFQCIGFIVWASVQWGTVEHLSPTQQSFYGLVVSVLAAATVVLLGVFYAVAVTPALGKRTA
jgi:hypothetical protein